MVGGGGFVDELLFAEGDVDPTGFDFCGFGDFVRVRFLHAGQHDKCRGVLQSDIRDFCFVVKSDDEPTLIIGTVGLVKGE